MHGLDAGADCILAWHTEKVLELLDGPLHDEVTPAQ